MATADPVTTAADTRVSPSESRPTVAHREIVRRLLSGEWYKKIAADHSVETVGFARDAVPGTAQTLVKAVETSGAKTDPAALATDWSGVLAQALAENASVPVLGVVLLTDGRQNASGDSGAGLTAWRRGAFRSTPF